MKSWRETLTKIGMKQVLNRRIDLVGCADAESPEAFVLKQPKHSLDRVSVVLVSEFINVVLLTLA
jgi:hypothetical protein